MTDETPSPQVSVLMPTHNGAAFVAASIHSLLAQSFGDFELIVVDDGSTDDTLDVLAGIADPRLTVIASPVNLGPIHARNRAFAAARGRYIAALDQDDLCRPERLARQVAYLDCHSEVVLVATATSTLEGERSRFEPVVRHTSPALIDWLLLTRNPLVWSSVMFRAEPARTLDPFTRPDRLYAEDFDLYRRLRPFGAIARIDEDLVTYREHPGGASKRYIDIMSDNAATVLAEAHAPVFRKDAHRTAALMIRHAGLCEPVRDAAVLAELSAILGALHAHFVTKRHLTPADRRAVDRACSRLWSQFARGALASGATGLVQAVRLAPAGFRWRYGKPLLLLLARSA
jgi:glycosyltransferase involved in cell wall biosynthesis